MRRRAGVLVAVALLAACGGGDEPPRLDQPAAAVEVVDDVDYYYACGNEVLELPDGRRFYPLVEQRDVDPSRYVDEVPDARAVAFVGRVVPPGPGDDSGTLTIYSDGMAKFVSDSGIRAWLTPQARTYDWEC